GGDRGGGGGGPGERGRCRGRGGVGAGRREGRDRGANRRVAGCVEGFDGEGVVGAAGQPGEGEAGRGSGRNPEAVEEEVVAGDCDVVGRGGPGRRDRRGRGARRGEGARCRGRGGVRAGRRRR